MSRINIADYLTRYDLYITITYIGTSHRTGDDEIEENLPALAMERRFSLEGFRQCLR